MMTPRSVLAKAMPGRRLDRVFRRLDSHKGALARHRAVLDKHQERLAKVERALWVLSKDCALIELQLGSLEAKVERLASERESVAVTGDPQDLARARNVVEMVQKEHEQIRARFQIITRYEERLRRVEDGLVASQNVLADTPS